MGKYHKLDIAANQLETAIGLYVSGRDKISAITLAGAADTIFCQFLANSGKENFTHDIAEQEFINTGVKVTIPMTGRHINDVLKINALKHLDKGSNPIIEIDIDECALGAVSKAIVNYIPLRGNKTNFIRAFITWIKLNIDKERLDKLGWTQ